MKLWCQQENLKRGLATVGRAVATKSPDPVLANVLLATDGERLKLAATDYEISVTCWIAAMIEEDGSTTLPARLLTDIVGNLPNDRVDLALDGRTQTVNLQCARFTNNIKGVDADDYPAIPTRGDEDPTIRLPSDLLRQCVEQVAFAAASDESRPVLKGVLVQVTKDEESGGHTITFAAADGYRLATRTVSLPEGTVAESEEIQEFIVPARALSELARILGDVAEDVLITVTPGGGQVLFCTENVNLVSRLIDGKFPDFRRIVPSTHTTRTLVDTQELMKAVKLASLFATASRNNSVRLTIEPGNDDSPGRLVLNVTADQVGDNTSELDGVVSGEGGKIAMNVKFMTEALNVMGTTQVALETQTSQSPGVFKPVGHEEYVHVIMPMTIRE
jgi:DNA polymerase-3 subunit beta